MKNLTNAKFSEALKTKTTLLSGKEQIEVVCHFNLKFPNGAQIRTGIFERQAQWRQAVHLQNQAFFEDFLNATKVLEKIKPVIGKIYCLDKQLYTLTATASVFQIYKLAKLDEINRLDLASPSKNTKTLPLRNR